MPEKQILFVDNHADFLNTRAEFLEKAGYRVWRAYTLEEAQDILDTRSIHLVILDQRMENDEDVEDRSGFRLVENPAYRAVAKIFLTDFPTTEDSRQALRAQPDGLQFALDYLDKQMDAEDMVQEVNEIFTSKIKISWNLKIEWNAWHAISLVTKLGPGLDNATLLYRADELEDLFCRLFFEKSRIRIERLWWERDGRLAITVLAFGQNAAVESYLVVCGQRDAILAEANRYHNFAPKAPGVSGTMLYKTVQTCHFAANAYVLANADLITVRSLKELYHAGPDRTFKSALNVLFDETVDSWHPGPPSVDETGKQLELYRSLSRLDQEQLHTGEFEERVNRIVTEAHALGATIKMTEEKFIIQIGRHSYTYPNPIPILKQGLNWQRPLLLKNTPGALSGDNILTDGANHTWLTDFAQAGKAPHLWSFIIMEATIRFDWTEAKDLQRLHEMERCLLTGRFTRPDTYQVEPVVRKPVKAIQVVRQLVDRIIGQDRQLYHYGMLFQAAARITSFDQRAHFISDDLAPLAHALIAAAMICHQMSPEERPTPENRAKSEGGLVINKKERKVLIRGREVNIIRNGFKILSYLYDRSNQVCTREEIVKAVYGVTHYDKSEEGRLNAAIRQLRKKIEDDPANPRFLLTHKSVGYRLVPLPKD